MNVAEQTLGLLSESDFVSLSAGVTLEDLILIDQANGAKHILTRAAKRPLRLLEDGMVMDAWFRSSALTAPQAFELIGFLNNIGCLRIRRTRSGSVRHMWRRVQLKVRGVRLQALAKRYPGTVLGIIAAVIMTSMPVILVTLGSLSLAYGASMLTRPYITGHLVLLGSLAVTTFLHEYIHLYIARSQGANAQVVVRGLRIGILHQPLSPIYEVCSALAGPLTGLVGGVAITFMVRQVYPSAFVVLSAGIVCVFHCIGWLPEYGDGVALRKYWRNRHERTT